MNNKFEDSIESTMTSDAKVIDEDNYMPTVATNSTSQSLPSNSIKVSKISTIRLPAGETAPTGTPPRTAQPPNLSNITSIPMEPMSYNPFYNGYYNPASYTPFSYQPSPSIFQYNPFNIGPSHQTGFYSSIPMQATPGNYYHPSFSSIPINYSMPVSSLSSHIPISASIPINTNNNNVTDITTSNNQINALIEASKSTDDEEKKEQSSIKRKKESRLDYLEPDRESFQCTYDGCPYVTDRNHLFSTHIRYHAQMKKGKKKFYRCIEPGCGYIASDSSNLRVHNRIHTGIKPFHCIVDGCSYMSSQKNNVRTHIRRNHRDIDPDIDIPYVSSRSVYNNEV